MNVSGKRLTASLCLISQRSVKTFHAYGKNEVDHKMNIGLIRPG